MKTLESLVTDLELSKELKLAGVPQESVFYWYRLRKDSTLYELFSHDYFGGDGPQYPEDKISAFTSEELGRLLPVQVNGFELEISKDEEFWGIRYFEQDYGGRETRFDAQDDHRMVNAFAKMLLHLIREGKVKF